MRPGISHRDRNRHRVITETDLREIVREDLRAETDIRVDIIMIAEINRQHRPEPR